MKTSNMLELEQNQLEHEYPPSLTSEALSDKITNELVEYEELIQTGSDPLQHNVMMLLITLFNKYIENQRHSHVYKACLENASIPELNTLIEIYSKHASEQLLDNWHARIWNDFLKVAPKVIKQYEWTGGHMVEQVSMPNEQFSEKLSLFKKEKIGKAGRHWLTLTSITMVTLYAALEKNDIGNIITVIAGRSSIAVFGSLPRDKIELMINSNAFLNAVPVVRNPQLLLNSLRLTMPRDLWDVFVFKQPIQALMYNTLKSLAYTPQTFIKYVVENIPENNRCAYLLKDDILSLLKMGSLSNNSLQKEWNLRDITTGLKSISLQLFNECMLDKRYIQFVNDAAAVIDHHENTTLHITAKNGSITSVLRLLKINSLDTNPNARNSDFETPLHLASRGFSDQRRLVNVEGQIACISALLNARADVNAHDSNGRTPLSNAISYQQMAIVQLLLTAEPDVNKASVDGITPLHWAAIVGNIAIVQLLLKAGAYYSRDIHHNAPLHYAARNFHADIVKFFLDAGVPFDTRNLSGPTPLELAQEHLKALASTGCNTGSEHTETINLLKAESEKANTGNTAAATGAPMILYGAGYMQHNTTAIPAPGSNVSLTFSFE